MWLAIFAVSILAGAAGALYLAGKLRKTGIFDRIDNKAVIRILCLLAVVALAVALCLIFDVTNMIVIILHVTVFLLAGDLVGALLRKAGVTGASGRLTDGIALAACIIYLCIGWFLMHGMWQTDYSLSTSKPVGSIRIAHIADSHVGTGFSGKGFGERLARIAKTEPDILVITGDFVDDSTMKQDMLDACEALKGFGTKYGIYYCLGNHDAGYYAAERRGYSGDELIETLEKSGVTVLRDESVLVDDRFYVTGRQDAGYGGSNRLAMDELVKDLDKDRYIIVLDHQPTDYDAEAASGVDLVLSGHTHGGQLWPLEYVQPVLSDNNNVRGYERRGNTDFIVTDGISDWAVLFKTGCRSEYNLIEIKEKGD